MRCIGTVEIVLRRAEDVMSADGDKTPEDPDGMFSAFYQHILTSESSKLNSSQLPTTNRAKSAGHAAIAVTQDVRMNFITHAMDVRATPLEGDKASKSSRWPERGA